MARLAHRSAPRRAGIARVALCALVAATLLASGCTSAAPEPVPVAEPPVALVMQRDIASVFGAVYGDEAVRAVIVQQHGEPVYERYWKSGPDDTWDIRGVTRTITSTLVGIAIDRGLIPGVDATLGDLLPEYSALLGPETAAIDLQSVLTSTAFFASTAEEPDLLGSPDLREAADWIAAVLADRAERGRGDGTFLSSEVGAHVLAAIVARAAGTSPLRFAREALFDPLGIETDPLSEDRFSPAEDPGTVLGTFETAGVAWLADPQGVNLGYTHLRLRPGDLVRIGQLFLDEGSWDGEQVVSPTWAVEATSPLVATRGYGRIGYGYQWWVDPESGAFFAYGQGGTALVVDPRRDAVAVIASEVGSEDERATHGLATSTAVGLAVALLDDLPGDPE